jgi:uncharacterized membrane protein
MNMIRAAYLATAACITVFLRTARLARDSVWRDEANTWELSRSSWRAIATDFQNHQPPLYYFVTKLVIAALGDSEQMLRLPSVFFGAASVGSISLLGWKVGGVGTGLLTLWFAALSPSSVFFSRQARAYSLFVLAVSLSLVLLAPVIDPGGGATMSIGTCIASTVTMIVLVYSHPYGLLAWAAIGGFTACQLMRFGGALQPWGGWVLLGWLAAGISFLPYARVLHAQVQTAVHDWWIKPLRPLVIFSVPGELLLGPRVSRLVSALFSAFVIAALFLLPQPWNMFAAALAIMNWVGPALAAYISSPLFVPRYALALQPLCLVAISYGIVELGHLNRLLSILACSLVLILFAYESLRGIRGKFEAEDWRGATFYLEQAHARGATPVVVNETLDDPLESMAVSYYSRQLPFVRVAPVRQANGWSIQLPEGNLAILMRPMNRLRESVKLAASSRSIVEEKVYRGVVYLEMR